MNTKLDELVEKLRKINWFVEERHGEHVVSLDEITDLIDEFSNENSSL